MTWGALAGTSGATSTKRKWDGKSQGRDKRENDIMCKRVYFYRLSTSEHAGVLLRTTTHVYTKTEAVYTE